ncbi:DUF1918 domain-containing protein [Gordonia sp. PKS22-38]|uniref:DUF1918 domain-containing protein n=1 Tax=Gordonia prachuapensis TaxID=3115651 RepID=A0ABU7MY88_9ACTN|nr:DUF1918 domain-containing protein [Gordonia sp. PKS22-38]
MHAQPGDWLEVEQSVVGRKPDLGEILEVRSADGSPPYLVRWSESGDTALVYPGADSIVRSADEVADHSTRETT